MALWLATSPAAQAHIEKGEVGGFASGFKHPWSGLDHIAAMVGVGLWGAQLGAPAIWLLPVTFPLIMAIGGFMGLGQEAYPLPWSLLTFSPRFGGYVVEITDEQLKNAPKLVANENLDMGDRNTGIYEYYGVSPYWF